MLLRLFDLFLFGQKYLQMRIHRVTDKRGKLFVCGRGDQEEEEEDASERREKETLHSACGCVQRERDVGCLEQRRSNG